MSTSSHSTKGGADAGTFASDAAFARFAATSAASALLSIREMTSSDNARELRAAGDAGAQSLLSNLLARHMPGDAVLSEEAQDSPARLTARRVWIIDPLDGTREYSEGRDDWAVHVALWEGGELSAGAVALGGPDLVMSSDTAVGSTSEGSDRLRIAISRSRPPALVEHLARQTDAEMVPMGSAGVKVCAVVRGEVDAYIHGGGQYEWDSAAPVAVARAAGLHTSRLDGSPLVYNRQNPYLPDLVVCRSKEAGRILSLISEATEHLAEGQS